MKDTTLITCTAALVRAIAWHAVITAPKDQRSCEVANLSVPEFEKMVTDLLALAKAEGA